MLRPSVYSPEVQAEIDKLQKTGESKSCNQLMGYVVSVSYMKFLIIVIIITIIFFDLVWFDLIFLLFFSSRYI